MLRPRKLLVHRAHHAVAEHDAKVGAPQRESRGVLPRLATTGVELGAPEGLGFGAESVSALGIPTASRI